MTATATKKERHLNVSQSVNGVFALCITQGKEKTGYYVRQIDADFGLAFSFTKFETDQEEGTPSEYAVNVDERGNDHSCECLGHVRWGHRHPCRHVAAIQTLLRTNRIQVNRPAAAKPAAEPAPFVCAFDDP
jgi:hypothetical protein